MKGEYVSVYATGRAGMVLGCGCFAAPPGDPWNAPNRHDDQGEDVTPTILRATRDMVNSHGSSSGLRVRRFAPSLSRAIALAMGGLALVVSSSVALAAGLTVGLGPPTSGSLFCDAIDACSTVFTGSLTDPSRPGTYVLQLTFDAPPVGDLTNVTQICFAPASSGPNQGILTFTSPDSAGHTVATGQVLLTP